MSFVLDASAILAVLLGEPGAERVQQVLSDGMVSAVNYSEVVAKLRERGVPEEIVANSTFVFKRAAVDFDAEQALDAGHMHPLTRHRGLSLGDRACLALAKRENATVLTADRAWAGLELGISVEVVR